MAKSDTQPSKARKGKPLTENPLFPAVVALWFGALFGLGSLAIRVGLLEQIVLASKIDTVISAAAPPLGVSARIALALVLAAIGAMLGATIARKIAAPKPVVRERKRGAVPKPVVNSPVELRARDIHPDAPARRPISAHEELGGGASSEPRSDNAAMAGRRRSALAIEHDDTFELHENAPLPGGAWQIHDADAVKDDALELGSFADHGAEVPEMNDFSTIPPAPGPQLNWQAKAEPEPARQMFQPLPSASAEGHTEPAPMPASGLDFAPPADAMEGRQVFGMAQPQPDEVLDQLGITDAEFEDFAPVTIPAQPAISAAAEQPEASAPAYSAPTMPAAPIQPDNAAADPDKPGMLDLAAKLAASMQRRRERAEAAAKAQAAAQFEAQVPAQAEASPSPVAEAAVEPAPATQFPMPQEFSAVHASAQSETLPSSGFLHPNDIPAPVIPELPAAEPAPAIPVAFEAPAAPLELRPSAQPVIQEPGQASTGSMPRMPAAMRPITLDFGDSDDADDIPASFLPPRSIAMAPPPMPEAASAESSDETAEEGAADDPYPSLLNVVQPAPVRQDFVRIEDPVSDDAAIEPVVIFPGQAARMSAESAPTTPSAATDPASSFRRFDAPTSAEPGQTIAAGAAPAQSSEETERALRAALANLQRMSGAA